MRIRASWLAMNSFASLGECLVTVAGSVGRSLQGCVWEFSWSFRVGCDLVVWCLGIVVPRTLSLRPCYEYVAI